MPALCTRFKPGVYLIFSINFNHSRQCLPKEKHAPMSNEHTQNTNISLTTFDLAEGADPLAAYALDFALAAFA
jgi:hypothetical protein